MYEKDLVFVENMAPQLPMPALKWADLTQSVAATPQPLRADVSSAPCELDCTLFVSRVRVRELNHETLGFSVPAGG